MTGDVKFSYFVSCAFFAVGSGKEVRITTVTQSVSARPSLREDQSSIPRAGLSLRAGGRGFSPANKRMTPGYFY